MIVTAVKPLDRRRSKVFLNEDFAFVLYNGECRRFQIEEGAEITEDTRDRILLEVIAPRARERAFFLLKDRGRTSEEIRRKLKSGLYPEEITEETIRFLEEYHYLDDDDYMNRFLELYGKKKSRQELFRDLMKKGIDREKIREALREDPADEGEAIAEVLRKKNFRAEEASPEQRMKMSGYLFRRGFSQDEIRKAVFLDRNL